MVLVFSVVSAVFHLATATNCTSQSKLYTFVMHQENLYGLVLMCMEKGESEVEGGKKRERGRGDREGETRRRRKLRK